MTRALLACLAVVAVCTVVLAEPKAEAPPPTPLLVSPAKAPKPALRYTLLPEVRDRTTGNAATLYYRAFSPEFMSFLRKPDLQDRIKKWLEMPLAELKKELPQEIDVDNFLMREVDQAARRSHCDWELLERARKDGALLLLPDVQGFREIAQFLSLRIRVQIADGRFDQAAHSLQTGFQLARHVCEGPTVIHNLVGIAIANQMTTRIEEWIATPDAPNLYWALAALPRPFIDLRKAFEGERLLVDALFPGLRDRLRDPHSGVMTAEEAQRLFDRLLDLAARTQWDEEDPVKLRARYQKMAANVHAEAKQHLIGQGRVKEVVEKMPVMQAALMFAVDEYDHVFDDAVKLLYAPYGEMRKRMKEHDETMARLKKRQQAQIGLPLAVHMLPSVEKVLAAQARLERRLAAMQTLEAIRLHAAENQGKLPASLAEIKAVAVPIDPTTGKTFNYRLEKGKAHLEGDAPAGETPTPFNTIRYEITLRK